MLFQLFLFLCYKKNCNASSKLKKREQLCYINSIPSPETYLSKLYFIFIFYRNNIWIYRKQHRIIYFTAPDSCSFMNGIECAVNRSIATGSIVAEGPSGVKVLCQRDIRLIMPDTGARTHATERILFSHGKSESVSPTLLSDP